MRILYDSYKTQYKSPFGALAPEELCTMRIHIPTSCHTDAVWLLLRNDRTGQEREVPFMKEDAGEDYEIWQGEFSLTEPDLYFYRFRIRTQWETFCLYRWGNHDTNMEEGGLWQLSCVSKEYPAPDWAKGAVMYQIFPDRFHKSGECDLTEKLTPYSLHENWYGTPRWMPDEKGEVWNNDFFGGNLKGIEEKLPYLQSLGVELIYLNPIFMAFSNHRYDTCDYSRVDPMLGTEEDFRSLCDAAHALGMHIILDGVFSHTGSRSIYFDAEHRFGGGAVSDPNSPYRSWYQFKHYPTDYESWWGFRTLPCVNELDPSFVDYIIEGENSILAKWIGLGADGFRLDVADELPDDFILRLRRRLRQLKPGALLLGEVWEDASNKEAYGVRRRYFTDGELDGVMNYPWRTAIFRFTRGSDDGTSLSQMVESLAENYPPQVLACTMNLLSSHDSARALTDLIAPFEGGREAMAAHRLTPEGRAMGLRRLRFAAMLQYCLPGMPCIYYGDEAGLEGCKDPFNRGTYPWGREEKSLVDFFRELGELRRQYPALRYGTMEVLHGGGGKFGLRRSFKGETVTVHFDATSLTWELTAGREGDGA